MTASEYATLTAVGASLFPHSVEAGSERVWQAWRGSLIGHDFREVSDALVAMAQLDPKFPALAHILEAIAERRPRPLGLAGPPQRPNWGPISDHQVIGPFSALFAEMNTLPWTPERLAEFCQRAKALNVTPAGGVDPRVGLP